MYIKDNKVRIMTLKKYKPHDEFFFTGLYPHKTSEGDCILFDTDGNIVSPRMKYDLIKRERFNKRLVYTAHTIEGTAGVLDKDAAVLVPFDYESIESIYLWSSIDYFIITKDNKKGLAKAVDEAPYLEMISGFDYKQMKVEMIKSFVLVGEKSDGSREVVKTNGQIIKL